MQATHDFDIHYFDSHVFDFSQANYEIKNSLNGKWFGIDKIF